VESTGVITPTQPKVPEAKNRGSQKGSQWVRLGLERAQGVLKGVQKGRMGPPVPLELSALPCGVYLPRGSAARRLRPAAT
jgi:hypothetical protein